MTSDVSGAIDGVPVGILRPSDRPRWVLLQAAVTCVVVLVAGVVLRTGQDFGLAGVFNSVHVGVVGRFASTVYGVFEPLPSIVMTAIAALVIFIRRDLRTAVAFAGVVALTWVPSALVKVIVRRDRPDVLLLPHPFSPVQPDPSFPSGHVAFVTAIVVAAFLVMAGSRWRWVIAVTGGALVVVVALCLAIDAVHFPTDILASVVWSLGVAPAARLVWVDGVMSRVSWLGLGDGHPRATGP